MKIFTSYVSCQQVLLNISVSSSGESFPVLPLVGALVLVRNDFCGRSCSIGKEEIVLAKPGEVKADKQQKSAE